MEKKVTGERIEWLGENVNLICPMKRNGLCIYDQINKKCSKDICKLKDIIMNNLMVKVFPKK